MVRHAAPLRLFRSKLVVIRRPVSDNANENKTHETAIGIEYKQGYISSRDYGSRCCCVRIYRPDLEASSIVQVFRDLYSQVRECGEQLIQKQEIQKPARAAIYRRRQAG